MKKILAVFIASLLFLVAGASAYTIGGDQSLIIVNCNVDGASVYFDNEYQGTVTDGTYLGYVYTTGTPYNTITVSANGYNTWTGSMPYPGSGQYQDVYATLTPVPTQAPIGGSTGTYTVYCDVNGASVYFGNDLKGTIQNGELVVPVYTTGSPYNTYSVQKSGYTSFSGQISEYPGAGENVKLFANLIPVPPTKSPLSIISIISALVIGSLGLAYIAKRD